MAVRGSAAFVVGSPGSSVHMIDVADGENLRQLARWETPGAATRVTVQGDVAYIADGFGGLQLVDTAQRRPIPHGAYAVAFGDVQDVAVLGDYVLLAGPAGIQVVDTSDPRRPRAVACFCGHGAAYRVAVDGALVLAAGGQDGLQIIDMADPARPRLLAQVALPGPAADVAAAGGYAYVAGGESGLHVVDVRTPARPVLAHSLAGAHRADAVSVDGARVYVLDRGAGLTVYTAYSARDAQPLAQTAHFPTPDVAVAAAVTGGTVYLTDRSGGLYLLRN